MTLTVNHSTPADGTFSAAGAAAWGASHSLTGAIDIANGGTGQTTAAAAITALTGAQTSGRYLRSDGTNAALSAIQAADVPTLNQNTTGTAANVTGIVAVANGGTGTVTPSIVAGTNVTVTGTWPNQTIAASGGGSSTITISNKTAAYTVIAGDLATVINCTSGTFTVSLTAAATLGAGFNVTIFNTGTGAITIDPNGAETIDGVATIILRIGEGTQIICDGTNWLTGNKKTMRGYAESMQATITRPVASGTNSVAIGRGSTASGTAATALGYLANAQNSLGTAIGYSATTGSSADYATAIGANSGGNGSQAVTGLGAMALGGSYASGTDSFAAGVADNTSTYGATGANSIAMGFQAKATNANSVAINRGTASGSNAFAVGYLATASGAGAIAISGAGIGWTSSATAQASIAIGDGARSTIIGKYAYTNGAFAALGDSQIATLILRAATTNATATVATSDSSAAAINNQVILPNQSAFSFQGTVVAKQSGSTNAASWKVEGMVVRGANAASTTLVASTVTAISNVPGWTLALSADTTNGGLTVTATGAAATNIRWVATIQTSEVTYA